MTRHSLITLAVLATLPVSSRAVAYAPAPMCALPVSPDQSANRTAPDATVAMCLGPQSFGAVRGGWPELCTPPLQGDSRTPVHLSAAQHAMEQARLSLERGESEQALLHLRVVAAALPEIADHVAMIEGATYASLGEHGQAAEAYYQAALHTPNADLRALARVGRAKALLEARDRSAFKVTTTLLRRYPELPDVADLKLAMGEVREDQKRLASAIAYYQSVDLHYPGYPAAEQARAHLEALRERKVWVRPYTPEQQVMQAENLMRTGPMEQARQAVAALTEERRLKPDLARRVTAMQARLALVEGRFEEARTHARKAPEATAEPEPLEDQRLAQLRVKRLLRGRSPMRVLPVHVALAIEIAARAQLTELTDELVESLVKRAGRVPPRVRFDVLSVAAGTASDEQLAALASTLLSNRYYGIPALYHRGRAYERAGKLEQAKADFEAVYERDDDGTRFYHNLADQRLRVLADEPVRDPCFAIDAPLKRCLPDRAQVADAAGVMGPDVGTALARLAPLADEHGEAYPWLPRALSLLQVGEAQRAADEIHEAYLAWRSAVGRTPLRAGTESIYRGQATARLPRNWPTRRARQKLNAVDRRELAGVAAALGDFGTAVLLGGRHWAEPLPRPFFEEVEHAAAKHGIDPDLLYAVMRVESVYNNRIISYAGAVGLMQIMPRTGKLIADALGRGHLTTTDLLRPEVNIEFAAWYLRSLLERMDGRLPLAIASYNGGPHNVRKWIHRYGEHVPLDAFLERIPFTQTHRYVRRVLGYYAQYRAQRGEKLALMNIELPQARVDAVAF